MAELRALVEFSEDTWAKSVASDAVKTLRVIVTQRDMLLDSHNERICEECNNEVCVDCGTHATPCKEHSK